MTDIAVIRKNTREELRISLDTFQGHDLVNLRVWFEDNDGIMRPSKKGLAFKLALLPEVAAALQSAQALLPANDGSGG